jgi:predicted AlkP superfamily phosphohydrolase/phosphomutase
MAIGGSRLGPGESVGRPRVLAIGLDGLEVTFAERLMAAGDMPALADLRKRAARFILDHGPAQRTGLAWEHVASGLAPEASGRWAAVEFDPTTYEVWQEGARFTPWWAGLDRRVVVFDAPYVDLRRTTANTRGIVGWGAHDPGTAMAARPRALLKEFRRRFGDYPSEWTYGTPWPSPTLSRRMGTELGRALDLRARAARWLAAERLSDWDFFLAVAGELHGTVEGLWHGVDPEHPLHRHPSATEAAGAVVGVHRGLDRLVGELSRAAGDATIVAFTMGGMGPNHSDTQSMVLLPELLYRHAFGRSLLDVPPAWTAAPGKIPSLSEQDTWSEASRAWIPGPETDRPSRARPDVLRRILPTPITAALRAGRAAVAAWRTNSTAPARSDLTWQPAARYRPHWPRMSAFALPSFYDGRVRVNLRGRERDGLVEPSRYEETCEALERLVRECRNPVTGEDAVETVERSRLRNPLALGGSECDLQIVWRGVATALEHPRLGLVGPVPPRRTGGHTGAHGVAYLVAPGLAPGDRGVRSSFDVVPTLVELLGGPAVDGLSGTSLLTKS